MSAPAVPPDDLRTEAARIAFALIRFEEAMGHPLRADAPPGRPVVGVDAYIFVPSWIPVPRHEVVPFLVGLPSPALLSPTTTRGMVALILLNELSGDRRRWGEKTLSNFTACFDETAQRLGLSNDSRILLTLGGEEEILSFGGVRLWTQQFGVQVGWNLQPLTNHPGAQARLAVRRSDGLWS